ncbi:hypothetical protein [Owenweeksia hongkongensis]|uniref:hypothetical protein n=1 Tax=Owenweeksia hongkongensis TaxID=253245 RepID=UPI003A8F3AFA
MAQFDLLSLQFNFDSSGEASTELTVVIDNPSNMQLDGAPELSVPEDVEIVAPGQLPTQEFWVYADHYHLTITLESGGSSNPLEVNNTGYFNQGDNPKALDVIVAEKTAEGKKKTRKIRRDGVILSE